MQKETALSTLQTHRACGKTGLNLRYTPSDITNGYKEMVAAFDTKVANMSA